MRVGVFGNMNNLGFVLVRYLRALGVDAHLLLFDDCPPHFHPSADTLTHAYLSYTKQLAWGDPMTFSDIPMRRAARDLDPFDQVWGSGVMPAVCQKLGRTLDVFVPYGSDVQGLTTFPAIPLRRHREKSFFELPLRQRLGVRSHVRILAMERAPNFDGDLARLGFRGTRVSASVPLLHLPEYDGDRVEEVSFWAPLLRRAKTRAKHVIFHHARHVWRKGSEPLSCKANDVFLRAFADFVRGNPGRAHLVTTEYGPDAPHSRALCDDLGISDHVTWLPILQRREVMACLRACDLATGDFDVGWLTGGVVFEVLASGKPLLHYRDESELSSAERRDLAPMAVAHTQAEIRAVLEDFDMRPAHYKELGARGRAWMEAHSSVDQVATIARLSGLAIP